MQATNKPDGLRASFNNKAGNSSKLARVTKALFGAAAISVALAGGSAAFAGNAGTAPVTAAAAQPAAPASGAYRYDASRTIRIMGSIDDDMAKEVISKLYELSQKDPKADIELRIDSGGGSVTAGFAIYDVMKSLPNDIRTVCEGNAQSMAAFLLSAGTQGKRYAFPNCEIMYHQPSWSASGKITDMTVTTAQGNVTKDMMISIIAKDTGWSKDVIRDLLDREFYPTAEEAREMGFIDHIITEQNPDPAAAPKTKLPKGFCDNPGRAHMRICHP